MVPKLTTSGRVRPLLFKPHSAAGVYTTLPALTVHEPLNVPAEPLSVNEVALVTVTVQMPFTATFPSGSRVDPAVVAQSTPAIATVGLVPVMPWLVAVLTLIGLPLCLGIVTALRLTQPGKPAPHRNSFTLSGPWSTWSVMPGLQL